MEIEEERAAATRPHGSVVRWFCSLGCVELFDRDPGRYVTALTPERAQHRLVIIGGGPAGLTAALYASIQRLETLLISDQIGGQAVESVDMQNYMGFQVIEGRDLVGLFRDQLLHSHFVGHRLDRAIALAKDGEGYDVGTERGAHYHCEAVILATGMKQRRLGVPGEERLLRRGVSSSVVQDAERFHGRDIAIVGGGNSGLQAVARLAAVGRRLYLIALGGLSGDTDDVARARASSNVTVLEHTSVQEVVGRDRVEGIRVAGATGEQTVIPVEGVFVEVGFLADAGLVRDLVTINQRGEVVVAPDCSTSVPGVFAAGDVTNGYGKRVIVACGEGAKAALAAYAYLARP